jgi:hypothetical protein
MNVELCVSTVGMSVWFSKDLGETKRASSSAGVSAECRVKREFGEICTMLWRPVA